MEGEKRSVNSELWHACAGPRISLPSVGGLVVYFPQGHSEQVAASTSKEVDGHIPNYPNLQSQLVCQLHNVALHADLETDEVFAQMTLQPVHEQERELFLPPDVGMQNRQPTDFFCKILTASDTSTHGGFSVPRRAAEKVFPPLDFSKQPPAQELRAKDLHDTEWTFRHIYRGQPKRHLLTTGWSVFVSAKRLVAGDSVLFIRDDKGQLLLGIRRASSKQQSILPSSVLSSDSMHIGVLAAAAHAAATSSHFQVFYNPRTSPTEFVIPFSKYKKAVHFIQVSVGMRFRMVFETEESTLRRYMGTITGIKDLDAIRWPGSKWRNLEVGWDESSAGERPRRVSQWEIEPVSTPFLLCPPFALRPKRPLHPGLFGDEGDMEGSMKRCLTWLRGDSGNGDPLSSMFHNLGGDFSWLQYQGRAQPVKPEIYDAVAATALQELRAMDPLKVMQPTLPQQGQFRVVQALQQQDPRQSNGLWPHPSTLQHQVCPNQQPLPSLVPLSQPQVQLIQYSQPLQLSQGQSPIHVPSTLPHLPSPSPLQHLSSTQLSKLQRQPQPQLQHQHQHQLQLPIVVQPTSQVLSQVSSSQGQSSLSQGQSHQALSQAQQSLVAVQPTSQGLSHVSLSQGQGSSQGQSHQSSPQVQQSLARTHQPSLQMLPPLQIQQSISQTQHQVVQHVDMPAGILQTGCFQPQVSSNLPQGRPGIAFSESDSGFASMPVGAGSFTQQGAIGSLYKRTIGFDDSEQLSNLLRASQSMQQQQENIISQSLNVLPNVVQQSQVKLESEEHRAQESLALMSNLPHIDETQLTGSWFHFSNETSHSDSRLLSTTNQVGQSDTCSSTITSSSYSLPIDSSDNTLYLPTSTGSFQTRFNHMNKEAPLRTLNDNTIIGSFSPLSGSFTSATPDYGPISTGILANGVLDEAILPQSWPQVPAPPGTYTKVHKSGSVGRSIDLSRLTSYEDLRQELARMFNLEGQLEDPQRSFWQLVFVDNDGDILLVGDDPWDEFVSCVRAINILSTAQVLQMNQEGLEQLSCLPMQQQTSSSSEDCEVWRDV